MSPPRVFYDEPSFRPLFFRFDAEMGFFARNLQYLDRSLYPYNPLRDFAIAHLGIAP